MTSRPTGYIWLTLFWLGVACGYGWAGYQQKQRVNLSATAGGQYPYLVYAKNIAEQGRAGLGGDRNRMPLYPGLVALAHHRDWNTFVERSAWLALASSAVILAGVGFLAYSQLPRWPATALTLAAVVCVFLNKASFVQAELLYYALLLAAWLLCIRLIRRPNIRWGVVAGMVLALAYLTKASGAAALVAYLAAIVVQAAIVLIRVERFRKSCGGASPSSPLAKGGFRGGACSTETENTLRRETVGGAGSPHGRQAWRGLLCGLVVTVTFLVLAYPYLQANQQRFGRYFYNVNSTFFMWCDSWSQAKEFSNKYGISEHYPEAPSEEIPGPGNYWKTHSSAQIAQRMGYGVSALGSLALRSPYLKYLGLVGTFCALLVIRQRRCLRRVTLEDWIVILFCGLFFGGYALSYVWYAQVAYGDRFLLSLVLPTMFGLLWLAGWLSRSAKPLPVLRRQMPLSDLLAAVLTVLLVGEGIATATITLYQPSRAFVQFYYNESRELLDSGNPDEAVRGLEGVIRLDPSFASAHHGLGMAALIAGKPGEAVPELSAAVRLAPDDADAHNSLGSALVQIGQPDDAILAFRRATELDPDFATAWFNLGGTLAEQGTLDDAQEVLRQLRQLDPQLAKQLQDLVGE